ncbi:hypothetical protein BDW62DRAFT_213564 [Aspergillus aurantiobrunneus]
MSDADGAQRSLAVQTVAAVFMLVACIAVLLRCYVRGWLIKAFGWDDGAMVIAMAFYLMFSGCMIGGTLYGTGHRFDVLTPHQRVTAMKYWWLCEIAYCFASIGCKISVCIFLMRITVKRIHIWILYTVMALTVITGLIFMFIMLLQCKPLQYFWTRTALDPSIQGSCVSIEVVITMTYVYSAFAALCDFTVGILPIFLVHRLQMRKKTKMAVVGILGMACMCVYLPTLSITYAPAHNKQRLLRHATVQIAIWSNIEAGLGITAGSLATLRPLLRHFLGSSHDDYTTAPSPLPFPRLPGSRRPGGRDRSFPLGSLDDSAQGRLRPDKLALTVTTVQTQREDEREDRGGRWGLSRNSSEERLTAEQQQQQSPGVARGSTERGMGIHRVVEVTQTSTEVRSPTVREHL